MFNTDSIIKEVNIITKTISYLMIMLALVLVNEPLFIIFVNVFLVVITKQYPNILKINLISLGMNILNIFYPQFLWITKILILIIYTTLLKKVTKATELRYILESTLYRFQQKQITYKVLYIIYFGKYFKNNIKKLWLLKDDYAIKYNFSFLNFILKQSYRKTKDQMQDFMQMNKLRFYNNSSERTYMEKPSWESWDTNYIIIHTIIFFLACFYGR